MCEARCAGSVVISFPIATSQLGAAVAPEAHGGKISSCVVDKPRATRINNLHWRVLSVAEQQRRAVRRAYDERALYTSARTYEPYVYSGRAVDMIRGAGAGRGEAERRPGSIGGRSLVYLLDFPSCPPPAMPILRPRSATLLPRSARVVPKASRRAYASAPASAVRACLCSIVRLSLIWDVS